MSQPFGHSAEVLMWLDCGAHGLVELSRISPKSVVAKYAQNIPPCDADLVVTVDDHCIVKRVNIARGFPRGRQAARIRPLNGANTR
jgi:hypothetical protein